MSDLISRKSMIDILKGVDQEGLLTICQIIEFIEDRPSAFDKEKVIEELRAERNPIYREDGSLMSDRTYISIDNAIEIVEKGGLN